MMKNTMALKKANGKCEICFTSENLTRHHIREKSKGGSNNQRNIQILCKVCHVRLHRRNQKGINQDTINQKEINQQIVWEDEEITLLVSMYKGLSSKEISRRLRLIKIR